MFKGTMMLFKVLCALRIKENIHKPICQFARFQWSHVAKIARRLLFVTININPLKHSCLESLVTVKLKFGIPVSTDRLA